MSSVGSESLVQKTFKLSARISSDNPSAIKPILERVIGVKGTMKSIEDGFEVEADLKGESARDLNRMLLSEMRKAERRTRIRAEWASGNTVEKFFDYVPKGSRKISQ
jgi:acylphosphatase